MNNYNNFMQMEDPFFQGGNFNRVNVDPSMNWNMNWNETNSNMNNNMFNPTDTTGNLFNSYEGFIKGNMFKDLYDPYNNYQPAQLVPNNEREALLLNLDQVQFAMHELNLYLDIYPNDTNMMNEFIKYRREYNRVLNDYETKFNAININSNYLNSVPFGWEEEPWPWDEEVL